MPQVVSAWLILMLALLAVASSWAITLDEEEDYTQVLCGTCPFPWNKDIRVQSYPPGMNNPGGVEVLVVSLHQPQDRTVNIVVRRSSVPVILVLGFSSSMRDSGFWNVIYDKNSKLRRIIANSSNKWTIKCNGDRNGCTVPVDSEASLTWLYPFSLYDTNNMILSRYTDGANITAVGSCYTGSEWRITDGGATGCMDESVPILITVVVFFFIFVLCCGCCILICVIVALIACGAGGIAFGIKYISKDKKPPSQGQEPLLNETQRQHQQQYAQPLQPQHVQQQGPARPPAPPPMTSNTTAAAPPPPAQPQAGLFYSNNRSMPPPVPVQQPQWSQPQAAPNPEQVPYTTMYVQPMQPSAAQQKSQQPPTALQKTGN